MTVAHVTGASFARRVGAARRRAGTAAVLVALVLAAMCALFPFARASQADEAAGYLTVSGVAGIDEGTVFATLSDALAAVAACPAADQVDDGTGATLTVYGDVQVDAGVYDFSYPVDGATCALVGGDGASLTVVGEGEIVLSNGSGPLVVRGVSFVGSVSFSCRDDLALDSCSFSAGVLCSAGGSLSATANSFHAEAGQTALSADLPGDQAVLTFVGNDVSGFACGVLATGASASVSVTSNSFELASDPAGEVSRTAVLRLGGGPWQAASVVLDGNAVSGAEALVVLDASFMAVSDGSDGLAVQTVADGTLSSSSVCGLFELAAGDAAGLAEGGQVVALDAVYDGSAVAAQVAEGSELLVQGGSGAAEEGAETVSVEGRSLEAEDTVVLVTVSYDPNGATGGSAPAAVTVAAGTAVSVETMGSLVYAGYVFEGWNTAPDGSGTFYAVGQVFTPETDTILYAQWATAGTVATVAVVAVDGAVAGEAA